MNEFQELISVCKEMAHKGPVGVAMAVVLTLVGPVVLVAMTRKVEHNG